MTATALRCNRRLLVFGVFMLFAAPLVAGEVMLHQESVVGFPIDGVREILSVDSGGDENHRLVVSHSSYILGLQWSTRRRMYEQTFFIQGDFLQSTLLLADINRDRVDELIIAHDEGGLTSYDAQSGALLGPVSLALSERIHGAFGADLDGGTGKELVIATRAGLSAYSGTTMLWHAPIGSAAVIPGRGSHPELFVAMPDALVVLDARTGTEKRRLPGRCSPALTGQFDSDSSVEVACYDGSRLQLIDTKTAAVQWQTAARAVMKLDQVDATGDGWQDVIVRTLLSYGSTSVEELVVVDGLTGRSLDPAKRLTQSGPVRGIPGDCAPPAIVVVEGGGTTFADTLTLLDAATLEPRSLYRFGSYAIAALAVGDLDRDGENELLVHHDGRVTTVGLQPMFTRAAVVRDQPWGTFRGMALSQLDADPSLEYVLAAVRDAYIGTIEAWDGVTHEPMWTSSMGDGEAAYSVVPADVNGDGETDIVSASVRVHSGARGEFVYAFGGRDGRQLWRSVNIPGSNGRVAIADTDGDGSAEILALSRSIGLVHLDRLSGAATAFDEFSDGVSFVAHDLDRDAATEVVVATTDRLFIMDEGRRRGETMIDRDLRILDMAAADLDGDGVVEILTVARAGFEGTRLQVRSSRTLLPVWTSELFPLVLNLGQQEIITAADVDNDGATEVVLATSLTVRTFGAGERAADLTAPRFRPGAALAAEVTLNRSCCAVVRLVWEHATADASPPIEYRVFRAGVSPAQPEVFLGTTSRDEFVDATAASGTFRYSVEVADAAGNVNTVRLDASVVISGDARCRRRSVAR